MSEPKPVRNDPHVRVGDEVLYHADSRWTPAEILAILPTGELALHYEVGTGMIRQRSRHGSHLYGWITYDEAAAGATHEVAATEP